MKSIILLTLGAILPLAAQVSETTETTTETTRTGNGGTVTETTTTTTQVFNPEARTKVVTYFDQYKTSPHGLPPGFVQKVKVKEIPVTWRTTRIAPGIVVTEKERPYLVTAPPELVSVLPAPAEGVRYYVAGSNVVSVDKTYKVVDSVQIPSIKYTEDEDEVVIDDGNKKTTIDKDDGEVEVEDSEED